MPQSIQALILCDVCLRERATVAIQTEGERLC